MLLLIGIDGASPEVIERLTSRGRMPVLRSLMRHGSYGRLASSANCNPVSAWASLLTGVNPGKHGAWSLFSLRPGSYDWQPAHARMLRAPTLLQLLTERGLEAGSLFVPMTYPAREAEWTTVAGWLAPSVDAEGFAYPARVAEPAVERLKDTPLAAPVRHYATAGRYGAGYEMARDAVQAKCGFAAELMGQRKWDFLAVNFVETDRLQRWYWHLIDRAHPRHAEEQAGRDGQWIENIYGDVDSAIGRLTGGLARGDQVVIVSTYGMCLNSRAPDCVPQVLERLGLFASLSPASDHWQRFAAGTFGRLRGLLASARRLLPWPRGTRLPEVASPEQNAARPNRREPGIGYADSPALPAPGGHVVLNIEGQFPAGPLPSGDADRLAAHVMSALSSAIDPATGRRPLDWARPREQVCHGPYLDRIPHIVTRWRSPQVVSGLTVTTRDNRVMVASPPAGLAPPGTSGPDGIFIVAGRSVSRGVRIHGARVEDVAATALHLCGASVPSYFDGQVITAALTEEGLAGHPVRTIERDLPTVIDDAARLQAANLAVEDHLRGLSYLA